MTATEFVRASLRHDWEFATHRSRSPTIGSTVRRPNSLWWDMTLRSGQTFALSLPEALILVTRWLERCDLEAISH
jgi:hypothetical protein